MTSPNTGIPYVPEGTLDPAAGLNIAIDHIDALLQCAVQSMSLTAPPGGEADGDMYIVASPATGAWAGEENNLARYVSEGAFYQFFEAGSEVKLVLNLADADLYKFDISQSPPVWVLAAGLDDAPSDGTLYGRKDGAWEAAGASLIVIDANDSPADVFTGVESIQVTGGLTATQLSNGVVQLEGGSAQSGHGTLTTIGIASNVAVMDHSLGADFTLELTSNVTTFTHSNITPGEANWFTLRLYQDGTGGRTFAVPASWKYGSGVAAYAVSSGITDVDLIQGVSYNDGTTWLISYEKDFT